ncbi:MAG: hypothetical protein WDO24_14605 [Pseudomonadota bacterium]
MLEDWREAAGLAAAAKPASGDQVTVGWREELGAPAQLVIEAAARADLVVNVGLQHEPGHRAGVSRGRRIWCGTTGSDDAEQAAGSGISPVAVIAWNGSHEANRAVAAALALLPGLESAHVFCQAESHRPMTDPAGGVRAARLATASRCTC